MKKINFENLPSTNTPISAGNLNQMQSNIEESTVIVSPTEPTTSEKVWIQKGKNLFNKNNVTRDVMLEDDGSLTSYYNYYVSDYIPIQSGKTYTLGTTASTRNKFFKSNYTPYSTGRDVDAQYNANTFTVPDDVCFIRITIDLNECDINQVQLEQGTAATPYEAYIEPKIYVKNDNGVYEEFINVEKINKTTYSTAEQRIGTWINGKPLYRKVIPFTVTSASGSLTYSTSNLSIDKVTRINGIGYWNGANGITIPYYIKETDTARFSYTNSSNTLTMTYSFPDATGRSAYCILEYTKTID